MSLPVLMIFYRTVSIHLCWMLDITCGCHSLKLSKVATQKYAKYFYSDNFVKVFKKVSAVNSFYCCSYTDVINFF